jgi:hypothetical protein
MRVMATVNRLLPGPGSTLAVQGRRLGLHPAIAAAAALGERAAARNNET